MKTFLINGKYKIKLPPHRITQYQQDWEAERLDHMHKTVKGWARYSKFQNAKPVVYYVGAEEGEMPALLSMWGATVVMIEPNPRVWARIEQLWQANNLEGAVTFQGFASNETKNNPKYYYGFPVIKHDGPDGFRNLSEDNHSIAQYKLDDLIKTSNLMPDIISIDVEGAEFEVLKGAENTLRTKMPIIYLSLHPETLFQIYKLYSADIRNWLKNMGYKETLLAYEHEVHLVYEATK